MLTGTIKADWIQLPVERYLAALPTLKQGVIAGVFKIKGAAPWAITRAEKLQLSVFLRNALSLDEWYAGVYALPTHGLMCLCWEPAICAEWSAMTFTTYGRSMMSQACGAISTHNGDYCKASGNQKGLVGTRSLREKSGSLPTGLIGLEMIWKMNFVLTVILLRGVFGVLHRTSYGSYASQLHP